MMPFFDATSIGVSKAAKKTKFILLLQEKAQLTDRLIAMVKIWRIWIVITLHRICLSSISVKDIGEGGQLPCLRIFLYIYIYTKKFICNEQGWHRGYLLPFGSIHTLKYNNHNDVGLAHHVWDSFHMYASQHVQVVCSWSEETTHASPFSLLASLSDLNLNMYPQRNKNVLWTYIVLEINTREIWDGD